MLKSRSLYRNVLLIGLGATFLSLPVFAGPLAPHPLSDAAIVEQFFPQSLIDEASADFTSGGPAPFRFSAFVAADLESKGSAEFLIAAYSNGFSARVRVIKKQAGTAVLVAEPLLPLMAGIYPEVSTIDVDGDRRLEILVNLSSAAGFSADWLFRWRDGSLRLIGPVQTEADGNVTTLLGDATFVDLDGDGILELINPPEPLGLIAPVSDSFTVFKLSQGVYAATKTTFNFFETFVRQNEKPMIAERSFTSPTVIGNYVLTIANGDGQGGKTVSSAEIYLNGIRVAGPSDFHQDLKSLRIPVVLSGFNTLSVRLAGSPGAELSIGIGPR